MKELHCAARDAYWLWREVGKPRQGDVFNVMKLSRSRFKFALRKCKRDRETVVANNFANKLLANEQRDLWGDIKHSKHSNCKTKRPLSMDGVHGD